MIALLGMNGGEEVLDRVRHFMFIISSSESCSSIVLPQAVQQRTCYSDSRASASYPLPGTATSCATENMLQ